MDPPFEHINPQVLMKEPTQSQQTRTNASSDATSSDATSPDATSADATSSDVTTSEDGSSPSNASDSPAQDAKSSLSERNISSTGGLAPVDDPIHAPSAETLELAMVLVELSTSCRQADSHSQGVAQAVGHNQEAAQATDSSRRKTRAADPNRSVARAAQQSGDRWAIPPSRFFSTSSRCKPVPGATLKLEDSPLNAALTEAERDFCRGQRIQPEQYLDVRSRLFRKYHGFCTFDSKTRKNMTKSLWTKSKAQQVKGIDVNKISKMFSWYDELGLWNQTWVEE